GIDCEMASRCPHVSLAYGTGECSVEELAAAASEIASHPFEVRVSGFDIFEGLRTGFDYLVLKLTGDGDFEQAVEAIQDHMACKPVNADCSHISLLRFPKGTLNQQVARNIVREMNASQAAAFALGRERRLVGCRVNVFDPSRECRLTITIAPSTEKHQVA
ncbi:MAG: hypothetical protein V4692_00415, partial [Bdellovibrionota bacterium]